MQSKILCCEINNLIQWTCIYTPSPSFNYVWTSYCSTIITHYGLCFIAGLPRRLEDIIPWKEDYIWNRMFKKLMQYGWWSDVQKPLVILCTYCLYFIFSLWTTPFFVNLNQSGRITEGELHTLRCHLCIHNTLRDCLEESKSQEYVCNNICHPSRCCVYEYMCILKADEFKELFN